MKLVLFLCMTFCTTATTLYAQCGKKLILESSETQYLDSRGTVLRTVDENTIIEIIGSEVNIHAGNNPTMKGNIKSDSCGWKTPFKQGKSVLKVAFAKDQNTMSATITIEGKDGQTTFLMETDAQPDRKIRVLAKRFEEKK